MMGFFSFGKKDKQEDGSIQTGTSASGPDILKEAYRAGRFTPSNTQCSPNFIDNWINNNVECFDPVAERIFSKYSPDGETKRAILLEMYRGFSDLILSEPEIEESAFRLKNPEAIRIAREIFVRLGSSYNVTLA
jgi:hypothetical protein